MTWPFIVVMRIQIYIDIVKVKIFAAATPYTLFLHSTPLHHTLTHTHIDPCKKRGSSQEGEHPLPTHTTAPIAYAMSIFVFAFYESRAQVALAVCWFPLPPFPLSTSPRRRPSRRQCGFFSYSLLRFGVYVGIEAMA